MGEDWQLLIEFDAEGVLAAVADELVVELGSEIGLHRVDGSLVAYARSPEAAGAAERRLRHELEKRGLGHFNSAIRNWDHDKQEWTAKGGDSTSATLAAQGPSAGTSWTVIVSLPRHREVKRLAEELKPEGWRVYAFWHTVEVVTVSRHDAELVLAEVRMRAPGAAIEIAGD